MKKAIFIIVFLTLGVCSFSQNVQERDSLARDAAFQLKVKMAAISAAHDLLADTTVTQAYIINYAQIILTNPLGGSWLTNMSYGVVNNPSMNGNSVQGDFQFTVNSIFVKYAKAEYRITAK